MKALRIKIDSFSDVITNSSTTIYVMPNSKSEKLLEEFINYLLKMSGSKAKAKDLFEIKTELSPDWVVGTLYDKMCDEDMFTLEEQKVFDNLANERKGSSNYSEAHNKWREAVYKACMRKINNNEYQVKDNRDDDESSYREDNLLLIPKANSKDVRNISQLMRNMFDVQEVQS